MGRGTEEARLGDVFPERRDNRTRDVSLMTDRFTQRRVPDGTLAFRPLYDSPVVSVRAYRCRACRGGPAAEERSDGNNIVLMQHGAFAKHIGQQSVTADVNQAVFFSKASVYRISHPADCGDRGSVFTPSPRVLNDIVREIDPRIDDRPDRPFPFVTSPCGSSMFWRHHAIAQRLEAAASGPLDPLWADVTVLQLLADVLESAFVKHGQPPKRRRSAITADAVDRTESAKLYLARRLGERITLDDVASAVHVSPFHFARTFRQQTGIPVHRYLTHLRLRNSLQRLADGADDLAALALELGFSSHSHFTDTFRREFGCTPSDVRRKASHRLLREVSKNLKA